MDITKLLQSRSARALDEDNDGRVLVSSDLTGTFQLYELDGELRQLTDFAEPVSGRYLPAGRRIVVQMDEGGNEKHQLYLIDAEDAPGSDLSKLEALAVSKDHVHSILGLRRDGRELAFSSNKRNNIDFDVYLLDIESRSERLIYSDGGWAQAGGGYSPGGRYLSFRLPGLRPLDSDLVLYDIGAEKLLWPLPHPDEAAMVSGAAWVSDRFFFASSDVGRDHSGIIAIDLESGDSKVVVSAEHDLECFVSDDGSSLFVVGNRDGHSEARLYPVRAGEEGVELGEPLEVSLPGTGVIASSLATPDPIVAPGGRHVTCSYSSPIVPGDVWRLTPGLPPARLTESPGPDPLADDLVEPETRKVKSFDGEEIPVFCYRPSGTTDPLPVVLVIHGGPESQSVLSFSPIIQGLCDRGFGVVVPNVRGSTGYGKRYASLDDTTRRLDSVRDLAAIHDWLDSAGFDSGRAALYGGSYGGYMVLAGVAFQPELWAAGIDIVGISDLVTFLENTSSYRRAFREREYGSLETDREFLASASPLSRVDEIRAPLFVIHGENDPRVPVGEARQLVASLERRGIAHELLIYPDEGHGLAKLANRLDAYPRAFQFLAEHLNKTSG
jgi:protease II